MSTATPPPEPSPPPSGWVWRCTDASIAAEQVSVFAVLETLLAVGVYWALVWRFNWPWMMFISLLAAPMLLLRSDASVALGLRWLDTSHLQPQLRVQSTKGYIHMSATHFQYAQRRKVATNYFISALDFIRGQSKIIQGSTNQNTKFPEFSSRNFKP